MKTGHQPESIRETVGVFSNPGDVNAALQELKQVGFPADELGLLASEETIDQKLGSFYTRTNAPQQAEHAQEVAFVRKDAGGDTADVAGEGLFFVGGTTTMGALVASAAVLGGPLAVAITGALALGAIGTMVGSFILKDDVHYLRDQIKDGNILLLVRHTGTEREQQARDILKRHRALDTRVYNVPQDSA